MTGEVDRSGKTGCSGFTLTVPGVVAQVHSNNHEKSDDGVFVSVSLKDKAAFVASNNIGKRESRDPVDERMSWLECRAFKLTAKEKRNGLASDTRQ